MLVSVANAAGGPPGPDGGRAGPDPWYYLANFQIMIDTLERRDGDLLVPEERGFIEEFARLPVDARALLVRMVMRKGDLFRASRLRYPEIADWESAAASLIARGWVDDRPLLCADELFSLFTKDQVVVYLGLSPRRARQPKAAVLSEVRDAVPERRTVLQWGAIPETVLRLEVAPLCERLRLMFFGNFRQTLKEFVLSDLGIFRYEEVPLNLDS